MRINKRVYETFNNGVYRCGFATKQQVYEQAVAELFDTLDWLETRLGKNRYLLGETITEADWRLFPTLFRFDAIYYSLFKCNLQSYLRAAHPVVLHPRALSNPRHRCHLRY